MKYLALLSFSFILFSCGYFGKSEDVKNHLSENHDLLFSVTMGKSTDVGRYVELEPESKDESIEFREKILYMLAAEYDYFDEMEVKQIRIKYPSETRAYWMTEIKIYKDLYDQFQNDIHILESKDEAKIRGIFNSNILEEFDGLADSLKLAYGPKLFNLKKVTPDKAMYILLPNNDQNGQSDTTLNFKLKINDGRILQNALISYSLEESNPKITFYRFWNIEK